MRDIVIVGTFDSRADAEQAARLLLDQGIDRSDIDIHAADGEPMEGRRSDESSWWDWLFGESEPRGYYTENIRGGGAVLTVTAEDAAQAQRVRQLMQAQGGDVQSGGATAGTGQAGSSAAAGYAGATGTEPRAGHEEREEVLPVAEEQLRVGKRPVARGGVRIFRRTSERPAEADVRLREERVNVERRPVDRPIHEGAGAFRDQVIEITEMGEEPVVAREARVVEEVVVSKDVVERDETVEDRVRRSDVEVERTDEPGDTEGGRRRAA
jgi:uncharacterized protein (TIGR02271 family)